jgi:hypothetical protein
VRRVQIILQPPQLEVRGLQGVLGGGHASCVAVIRQVAQLQGNSERSNQASFEQERPP